ncbi:glycosyltransferase [Winogradskyella ursingii]|uniref:glycosyltransferase n=1 Tax=Winogradskyella ursingii TaxID=2686079 RepID=UPI0015CBAFB4|nr:glycosyltransferase [Winogradskyella ursingii]
MAKEFSRQGHDLTVLTTEKPFDYSNLESEYGFKIKSIVKNEPPEIQGDGIKRIFRFSLLYFFQYPHIALGKYFKNALLKEKDYDLLISVAHPYTVHFGVALAKAKNRVLTKTWVADCGDPFANNQHGRLPYPFYYRIIENWFCKRADFITIPIKEAIKAYPKFCREKIKVIPQGFNFNDTKPSFVEGLNDVPTFAYAGNLSSGLRDPRPLLDFLIETNRDFKCILYTRNKDFLIPYKSKLGDKLEIKDYVPRKVLLKVLGKMDFLLNLENKGNVQRPSKLIDYALLERPILSISPLNVEKKKVLEFLNGDYENTLRIEDIDQYSIEKIVKAFLNLS